MLKKWFGRKKDDDEDDDFDEDDFDEEDIDISDEGGPDQESKDTSDQPGAGDGDESSVESDAELEQINTSADSETAGGDDIDLDGIDPDDFDDDDDDDFDDDDEEDDEEEEGRFAVLWDNTLVRLSIITLGTLFLLVGIGLGGWWFIVDGADEQMAAEQQASISSGGGLQPTDSLNSEGTGEGQVPTVGQALQPKVVSNESVSGEQLSNADSTSGLSTVSGLNAIVSGSAGGGLNTISGGSSPVTPGSGIIVPMTTASSFSQFPDYPANDALPKAPVPELLEFRDGDLPLPKISNDGKASWQEYARPSDVPSDKRRVALVISDLGLSRAATLSAISKFPAAVSLSFSPYAEELEQWMIRSRREGHEVLLGIPLESNRFPIEDPGPLALGVSLSDAESKRRLDTILSSQQGYIGVEVSMGSKFTADEFKVRELLTELNTRGLMIVDGAWSNRSMIPRIATEMAMPHVISSVRLDDVMAKAAVEAKLNELDSVVEIRSQGIGSTTITPAIMEQVLAWISSLPGKGVELVPVSALISTGSGSGS